MTSRLLGLKHREGEPDVEVDASLDVGEGDVLVVGVGDLDIAGADEPDGRDGGEVAGVGVE